MATDIRLALRMWRENPVPALAAVLTLALGAGANAAIFTVIYAVMLKPLPYSQRGRLAQIWSVDLDPNSDLGAMSHRDKQLLSVPALESLRKLSRSWEDIGYYLPWMSNAGARGEPERIHTARISTGLLPTLKISPARGRGFTPADMAPGRGHLAILSDSYWRRRFHSDSAVLGQTLTVDGFPTTIIGILPPDFRLVAASITGQPELLQPSPVMTGPTLGPEPAFAIGRLKPDVTLQAARDEMAALVRQLPPDDPRHPGKRGIHLVRLDEEVASGFRPALLILFAAAACVLLIACGNIAALVLAATAARERELALRTALGAPRRRLVRQLLTESSALAAAGTGAGLLLSLWAVRAIVRLYPEHIPRLESLHGEPAWLVFSAFLALVTTVLCGGVPAWRYSRRDVRACTSGPRMLFRPAAGSSAICS